MKSTSTLLFFLFISNLLIAQNVIWSEDFGGGQIPPNWTNTDVSGQISVPWIWETAGIYFPGQPSFASPTASNGFAMFDSYIFGIQNSGSFPQNHDGRLTTDAIDCSSLASVVVRFSNQYSYFTTDSEPLLGVSTDGTNFIYFSILTNVNPSSQTSAEQVEEVDISSVAAGESSVYLQFRWIGNFEYMWRLDDIKVQDTFTPLLPNNTAIHNYSIPSVHQMPLSQIDTFFLESRIDNLGLNTQTNLTLKATIRDNNNGQTIYTDSNTTATLSPLAANTLVELNDYYNPNLAVGSYSLTYNLTQDSMDNNPVDNNYVFDFLISDSTFALDNGNFTGGFSGGQETFSEGGYAVANYYYVPNSGDVATSVTFAIHNPQQVPNETIDFILYQIDIDNDGNLDDDGNGIFNSADLVNNVKAFSQYTFSGNEIPDALISIPLQNFANPSNSIVLDSSSSYLIVMEYAGNNLLLFTTSESLPYTSLSSIGVNTNNDTWYLGGFPNGILAVIRLNVNDESSASKPINLAKNTFEIFPNPVKNKLNLKFNSTENLKEVKLQISDASGRKVLEKKLQNIQNQTFSYNIQNLSSGNYFINIQTEKGQLTKKIVVLTN